MIRLFALCPDRVLSLALSLPAPPVSFSLSHPRAFISLRAVQFIPHSRTVRTPIATTFNKYRINAFTARRTDRPRADSDAPTSRRVKFADRVRHLLASCAFVLGRRSYPPSPCPLRNSDTFLSCILSCIQRHGNYFTSRGDDSVTRRKRGADDSR